MLYLLTVDGMGQHNGQVFSTTEIMIHGARTVPNHTKAVGGIQHVMVLILMGCI